MKFDSNKNKTFKAFNVFIVFIKHFIISKEMLRKIGYIECHSITLVSKHQSVLLYLMDHFTISDIEQLSGIKAHTLRVWEQRYRIFTPKRKDSQHRYYDNEDLKYILRIANLNHKGYKISKIARMSSEEIRSLTIELAQTESMYEQFIAQMLEATLALDEIKLKKAFDTVTLYAETEEIVMHLLYPFMSRLGMNWMADVVRPVHEHFASNFVAGKILQATHALESASNGPGVILFTPEGEYHENRPPCCLFWREYKPRSHYRILTLKRCRSHPLSCYHPSGEYIAKRLYSKLIGIFSRKKNHCIRSACTTNYPERS